MLVVNDNMHQKFLNTASVVAGKTPDQSTNDALGQIVRNLQVTPIPQSDAKRLLVSNHYLHSLPDGTKLNFGIFYQSMLMGAITLGVGPFLGYGLVNGATPEDCRVGGSNHVCCLFKERNGILISLLAVTLILSQLHATINTLLVFLRQALTVGVLTDSTLLSCLFTERRGQGELHPSSSRLGYLVRNNKIRSYLIFFRVCVCAKKAFTLPEVNHRCIIGLSKRISFRLGFI